MMLERKLKQARERVSVLGDALVEADLAVCCEGCQEIFLNDEIPAKKKTRFYQWRICSDGQWFRPNNYYSEEGRATGGYSFWGWSSLEKQKVMPDLDFVEIEVGE